MVIQRVGFKTTVQWVLRGSCEWDERSVWLVSLIWLVMLGIFMRHSGQNINNSQWTKHSHQPLISNFKAAKIFSLSWSVSQKYFYFSLNNYRVKWATRRSKTPPEMLSIESVPVSGRADQIINCQLETLNNWLVFPWAGAGHDPSHPAWDTFSCDGAPPTLLHHPPSSTLLRTISAALVRDLVQWPVKYQTMMS